MGSGGVKVLPCESGQVVGTRPSKQGVFFVMLHFNWWHQTTTDAVKCMCAERVRSRQASVWMHIIYRLTRGMLGSDWRARSERFLSEVQPQ